MIPERCDCGAEDCRRCRPGTWNQPSEDEDEEQEDPRREALAKAEERSKGSRERVRMYMAAFLGEDEGTP